jgi:pantothenate kinase
MKGLCPADWKRLTEKPLYLDQTDILIEFNREEVELFYLPLAQMLIRRCHPKSRLIVGIAGPPGSGKTIFATILVSVVNIIVGHEYSVYVGLDGWHYPNTYLETHTTVIGRETIPLREIKGAPETFDTSAALDCLQLIQKGEEAVHFPLYSRKLHDPVPEKGTVKASHRIIIVEGNYLLLDEDPWNLFLPLIDISIFLEVETSNLLDGLHERHLRGGKPPDLIEKHLRRVDLPNTLRVKSSIHKADVTVHKVDNRRIASIDGLE